MHAVLSTNAPKNVSNSSQEANNTQQRFPASQTSIPIPQNDQSEYRTFNSNLQPNLLPGSAMQLTNSLVEQQKMAQNIEPMYAQAVQMPSQTITTNMQAAFNSQLNLNSQENTAAFIARQVTVLMEHFINQASMHRLSAQQTNAQLANTHVLQQSDQGNLLHNIS